MELLNTLDKIYQQGEILSSGEMNDIVQYINSSINAINALITSHNNNTTTENSHCEIRYKISENQPLAPTSGSNGLSNSWSRNKPSGSSGSNIWLTIGFINNQGIYGTWSDPICINQAQKGDPGNSGDPGERGSFKSRVFKRSNTIPNRPTGGTYDQPYPGGQNGHDDWWDGIPGGNEILWSSVKTFYGNGLNSAWSEPAQETDTNTLDIEFSPLTTQPDPPTGDQPFQNHENERWYDPSSQNFDTAGTMIWRAERKVANGVYKGNWTITRIKGEKGENGNNGQNGGHYEFRYRNYKPTAEKPVPKKPSNGSNGITTYWQKVQPTLSDAELKDGKSTWMTYCLQDAQEHYGEWSDPFRITGANGREGEDGNELEFIYTRNNDGFFPPAPETTQNNDWPRHLDNGVEVDYADVEITLANNTTRTIRWYDNPKGVSEDMMYEFVSQRAKINDVWTAYSPPVIWSKWGEKGQDGDGVEYIFKHFKNIITTWSNSSANTNTSTTQGGKYNPANWFTSATESEYQKREYIYNGSGWSDDPEGIDSEWKYEYVSTREYRLWPNETEKRWGPFSTPVIWNGLPGVFQSRAFTRTNDDISDITPTGGSYNSPIPSDSTKDGKTYVWYDGIPDETYRGITNGEAIIWSTTCTFNGDGSSNGWSNPQKESDTANLDIEFSPEVTQPNDPSSSNRHGCSPATNQKWFDPVLDSNADFTTMIWRAERKIVNGDYVGSWVITRIKGEKGDNGGHYVYRYMKNKTKPSPPDNNTDGTNTNWVLNEITLSDQDLLDGYKIWMTYCLVDVNNNYSTWHSAIRISGANGLAGEDGSDVEFIYTRNNDGSVPNYPTGNGTGNTKTFSDNDWFGKDNYGVTWTDNPVGVEQDMRFEFIAVREKPAGRNQSWGRYHVALWSKWGDKGADGDGVEYIFKRFQNSITWKSKNVDSSTTVQGGDDNPANWDAKDVREYRGPENFQWSDDPEGINSTYKYEYVSIRHYRNNTWTKYSTPKLWARYAVDGTSITGDIGPMSYLAGVWDNSATYIKNNKQNPIVYYVDNDYPERNGYYYLTENGPSYNQNPYSSGKWTKAEYYNTVFTDVLFVKDFAKLGRFIVNQDWFISQYGILYDSSGDPHIIDNNNNWTSGQTTYVATNSENNTPAYITFDPESPNKNKSGVINFVPYLAMDALTGECYFQKGTFNGTITAGNGSKIGNFTVDNSGNISAQGNATFTGNISASSGSITGDITIGNGNKKMYIVPDSDGAKLIGKSGDTEVLSLGFYDTTSSHNAQLRIGSSRIGAESAQFRGTSQGELSIIDVEADGLNGPIIQTAYNGSDGLVRFLFGCRDKFVRLQATDYGYENHKWPTSSSQVQIGEVYVESDGILRVKLS